MADLRESQNLQLTENPPSFRDSKKSTWRNDARRKAGEIPNRIPRKNHLSKSKMPNSYWETTYNNILN